MPNETNVLEQEIPVQEDSPVRSVLLEASAILPQLPYKLLEEKVPQETLVHGWYLKPMLWILTLLPECIASYCIGRLSATGQAIIDGATSWKALDVIYHKKELSGNRIGRFMDRFWLHIMNATAVRNRLAHADHLLRCAIESARELPEVKKRGVIRILCLAAGSSEKVLQKISEYRSKGVRVECALVDHNADALAYALKRARELGILDHVIVVEKNLFQIRVFAREYMPHIVEMIGFLDYLDERRAIFLIKQIYSWLPENGIFLTANIKPHWERDFLERRVHWTDMVYRDEDQITHVLAHGGFYVQHHVTEDLDVHTLVLTTKNSGI